MKKLIATDRAPRAIGPYSQAVETDELIFTSGVIPINPVTGELVIGGIQEQADQAIANLVELVRIFEKQDPTLPFRVDHGKTMLGDEKVGYNPGYSFHGRMLALGQVEGMMAAVRDEIKNQLI